MIRCPKCGKMNQDSSRFCNECGATLPQTRIRCPKCGTMNPIGNVLCMVCNTRLLPLDMKLPEKPRPSEGMSGGVKGISLPSLSAKEGTPEPTTLPDWMLGLTPESAGGPESAAADLPDWLTDMLEETTEISGEEARDVEEPLAPQELPDWFSALTEEAPVSPETPAVEESLPDWLADMTENVPDRSQTPPVMTEPPAWTAAAPPAETFPSSWNQAEAPAFVPEANADLPDWLRSIADAPTLEEPQSPAGLPAWLLANADAPVPVEEPAAPELPAWLLQGAEEIPHLAPESVKPTAPSSLSFAQEPVREAEQDWLSGILPEESAPVSPAEAEPDWLSGIPFEEPEAAPEPAPPTEAVPDWLSGILIEEPEAAPEPTPPTEAVPDWLSGILIEEPEAAPEPTPPTEAVPDWLSGILIEEPEAAPEPTSPMEAMPDWLSGVVVDETKSAAVISEAPPVAEEMPDWLQGLTEQAVSPLTEAAGIPSSPVITEAPDWLAGLEEQEKERPAPGAPVPLSAGEPSEPESAMPGWLKDIVPPAESVSGIGAKAIVVEEESEVEAVEAALFGEAEVPEGPPIIEEAMPDWLKDLTPTEMPQSPVVEEIAPETLARAEVPAWLQGLRPPGTGPLPSLPEVGAAAPEVPGAEGQLARAEIPEWVQALRPAAAAEHAAESPLFPDLVETEGPLAGIVGVLPAAPGVDMPVDFEPVPLPEIPEFVVAHAQRWQQLLEQPRGIKRPVAQQRARSGEGEMATRWIVALVLLAVTILGLLFLGDMHLSQALSKPPIEHLSTAIQALEPGEPVVVAVEYGPAEAGEMTPIAEALVEHLQSRGVHITLVSTLPEGTGLAQGLFVTSDVSVQALYLPGSSSGIAVFLNDDLKDARLLVVLTSRTERLRWWMEQNNASHPNAPIPMGVGVSAAVGPQALPYLETPVVTGWLVGLPDAVAYREFRNARDISLNRQLDVLLLTHWAALGLLFFGLFYYLARGKKGAV